MKKNSHLCVDVYAGLDQHPCDSLLVRFAHGGVGEEVQESRQLVVRPRRIGAFLKEEFQDLCSKAKGNNDKVVAGKKCKDINI